MTDRPADASPAAGESRRARFFSVLVGIEALVLVGAVLSFLGWALDVPALADWDGDGITIQPNATLAATFAACALLALAWDRRRLAGVFGAGVAAIGGTALLQYVLRADFGIDTLLMFDRTWGRRGVLYPGRMGPPGAVSWTLLGIGLLLAAFGSARRARGWASGLGVSTAAIASVSLVGYLYGAQTLYSIPTATVIALQTAAFIFLVSACLVASVPETGLARAFAADDAGGRIARRLGPLLVVVPVLVGLARTAGERAGLYDSAFGSALRTVVELAVLLGLLLWAVRLVAKEQRLRRETDEELQSELADAERLQSLSLEMLRSQTPTALCEKVVRVAAAMLESDFASLQVLLPERGKAGELRLLASHGFSPAAIELWQWVAPLCGSSCGQALHERRRVVGEDLERCDWMPEASKAAYREAGIRACQSTPLLSRDGLLLGMLSTHWKTVHTPSARDLRLLDILCRQAADLLDRMRYETEREGLLEKERAARAAAENAAAVKDQFLATVSHELRTPLNAVLGWTQILRKDLSDRKHAEAAIEVIERNGRQQAQLIGDLLDMGRIVAKKMRLDVRPVDLRDVVAASVESMRPAVEAKGLDLDVAADESVVVLGDASRLQQVLSNLLSNAAKFTPAGGRIRVALSATPDSAEVVVRDTGPGIPAEFLPRLFERFEQADGSDARAHGGLGIGLALVRELVRLHGGNVSVGSEGAGTGSKFVVTLPRAMTAADGRPETVPARSSA